MDDLFGEIECRSKLDSVVMRILRSAMDKAHEKVQSKDGPIEFLHARSTFYELAAILVEGGLYIVQEEMEFVEGSHDKVLADLLEIKHWLQGRIEDMKHLITEKDRELMEKLENECKLRRALEMREEELSKLVPEKVKNEELSDFPSSNQEIHDVSADGDISKLKSSLDKQVWNIKQKLDDEEKIIFSDTRKITSHFSSPDLSFEFLNDKIYGSCGSAASNKFLNTSESESSLQDQNVLIKRVSSDIDILKETLDLAFGKLQRAEVLPLEKQWRCIVEKDIEHILMKGFMSDLQLCFDLELRTRIHHTEDNWADFISEMKTLCYDLKAFCSKNDADEGNSDSQVSTPTMERTRKQPLPDFSGTGKLSDEEDETSESRYVAKLIKNHESIIKKQSKARKWLTRDLQRKSSSDVIKINEDHSGLEGRLQGAITRLENLIKRSHRFGDNRVISNRKKIQKRKQIPKPDKKTKKRCASVEILEQEIENLKEERDALRFHISTTEETYKALLQGMVNDVRNSIEILEQEIGKLKEGRDVMRFQTSSTEETYKVLFLGIIKDVRTSIEILEQEILKLKEDKGIMRLQISSAEETYQVLYQGIINDARSYVEILEQEIVKLKEDRDVMHFRISSTEETYQVLFQGILEDFHISVDILGEEIGKLKEVRDLLHFQITLTESIYQVLLRGMVKDVAIKLRVEGNNSIGRPSHTDSSSFQRNEGNQCDSGVSNILEYSSSIQIMLQFLESSIRWDIHIVFLRETFKQWNRRYTESRLRFRRSNTFNSIDVTPRFRRCNTFNSIDVTPRSRRCDTDSPVSTPRSRKVEVEGEESFIQKLDSLARCLEAEEDLMLKASSEIKEHSVNNSLVILNCEEVEERDAIEWLLTDDESMFTSVSEKLERALQQLYASKELLFELEESLEESDDIEENDIDHDKSNSVLQQDDENVLQTMLSDNVLVTITQFQHALKAFEKRVHNDLDSKCLRVKELECHIDSLAQPVSLIKSRKLLYKKAFISRCDNLRIAESEVDLLGDQVESLVSLLEKVYVELNQNATILSQYFGVFDMLKLIRTELDNEGVYAKS